MLPKDFVIVSDGACDLPLDIIEKYTPFAKDTK